MKRILIISFMCMLLVGLSAVESKIRFGFFAPDGAETSIIGGFTYGKRIDEAVGIDMSFDFYYKGYTESRKFSSGTTSGGLDVSGMQKTADIKTTYIPLLTNLYVHLPVRSKVNPYLSAGIGWGLLWEDVFRAAFTNDDNEDIPVFDEVTFYSGFAWNISAGASYQIGRKSHVFAEAFYHGAKMKNDIETTDFGVTWDEIDMSGLGMRVGVEFSYNLR
ncbi:MAG: porin family protein [Candidatus Cloacimonetes bacterium]|nr:porin family protein [Candidatus Cloacimonadota bacterium]